MTELDRSFRAFLWAMPITNDDEGNIVNEMRIDVFFPVSIDDVFDWVRENMIQQTTQPGQAEELMAAAATMWGRYQRFAAREAD